jgi:hypothetical protein
MESSRTIAIRADRTFFMFSFLLQFGKTGFIA